MIKTNKPCFDLGQVVGTPASISFLTAHGVMPASLLERHATGDWGDTDDDDSEANDQSLEEGSRIFSVYNVGEEQVWIITDAENDEGKREVTTIMLPSEY